MQNTMVSFLCLFLFLASCACTAFAQPEQIITVNQDGSFELDSGETIALKGIELSPEARHLFSVLVAGREIKLKYDRADKEVQNGGPRKAYVYVETEEIGVPFNADVRSEQKVIMLNEFLIFIGAARVSRDAVFDFKESFLEIEEQARLNGEGIWSYDETFMPNGDAG